MVKSFSVVFLLGMLFLSAQHPSTDVFISKTGTVKFVSEAPLERIEAASSRLGAVINKQQKTVAFKLPVSSFEGFNSALQKEHFNENYLETDRYATANFSGKIIEEIDLNTPGTYKVRAKGMLEIHGVQKERIVQGTLVVAGQNMKLEAKFDVPLADHQITIPKIVNQKIAEVIKVEVKADLSPQA